MSSVLDEILSYCCNDDFVFHVCLAGMCGQIGCVCNNAEITPEGLRGQPTEGALLAAAAKVTHIVQAFVVKMVHHGQASFTHTVQALVVKMVNHGQASFHTHSAGISTVVVKVVHHGQESFHTHSAGISTIVVMVVHH